MFVFFLDVGRRRSRIALSHANSMLRALAAALVATAVMAQIPARAPTYQMNKRCALFSKSAPRPMRLPSSLPGPTLASSHLRTALVP